MTGLLADPWFYAAAIPAVILVGLSKGGFGGAVGFVGVPLMALVMPPVQAAAILLPILVLCRHGVVVDVAGDLRPQRSAYHAARRHDRHCDRLADGRRRYRRHGAADCRNGRLGLRPALGLSAGAPRRRPRRRTKPRGRPVMGHGFRLHQLRRPCRRATLPGLHPAAQARPQGVERHLGNLLRHHQRRQTRALLSRSASSTRPTLPPRQC